MKETVYIETSVVSYYTSKPSRDLIIAARQEISREKWPQILDSFEPYISALVVQEAEQGDQNEAQKRLDAISTLPVLSITDEAEKLAFTLIKDGPITKKNPEDALHIALATANGMDYLVTWNFAHINNAQMKSKIISIIERNGYHCPIICSPEELLGE
ncbi:MAG: type II toxin-antitoxin system VapC family toxin [bacterium]